MRIAMLGGTFDPIHYGHIQLGQRFADLLELDKVLVIPTRTPPHKKSAVTDGAHRLEMCRLASEYAGEVFEASDIELQRDGLSYSYYTLASLHELYPDCELYMLIGADMFVTLDTWYRSDGLRELATFCTVPRADISEEELWKKAEQLEGWKTVISNEPLIQVSSTQLREAAAKGEPLSGFVPPAVEDYIKKNGLYQQKKNDGGFLSSVRSALGRFGRKADIAAQNAQKNS